MKYETIVSFNATVYPTVEAETPEEAKRLAREAAFDIWNAWMETGTLGDAHNFKVDEYIEEVEE